MGYEIEFYKTESGRNPVAEFIRSLQKKQYARIVQDMKDYKVECRVYAYRSCRNVLPAGTHSRIRQYRFAVADCIRLWNPASARFGHWTVKTRLSPYKSRR